MRRFFVVIACIMLVTAIVVATGIGLWKVYADSNINYALDEKLFEYAKGSSTATFLAYNDSGELEEYYKGDLGVQKTWYDFDEIPENIKLAFLAIEDRHFYTHSGIDIKRTVAAFINKITKSRPVFGASTITQQVIKNISGDNEQTIERKVNEIFRALHLEMSYSKNEIFEMYLNIVPMTGMIYGVGEASYEYFGKEPMDLTLAEAATIAGITNSPVKYNPYTNEEKCTERRNLILLRMLEEGFIDNAEYEKAIETPLIILHKDSDEDIAPWFVECAVDEILADLSVKYGITDVVARLMLYSGTTSILSVNPKMQNIVEKYVERGYIETIDCGFVVNDPYTNNLLAIVGNSGKKSGNRLLNNALIPHSPASTIKPLSVYAPAIDSGLANWSTIIDDSPIYYIDDDEERIGYPKNSPDIYEGSMILADALRKSKNTVAVKLYNTLGEDQIFNTLKNKYGFTTLLEDTTIDGKRYSDKGSASLALGQMTYGVSLRNITSAYAVFPGDGVLKTSKSYYSVFDRGGEVMLEKKEDKTRIMSIDTARIMTQMLKHVVDDGTARGITLKYSVDVAGKTGTSSGGRDRWFVGFTPYFLAGIWVANNDNGGDTMISHIEIWDEIMSAIHEQMIFKSDDELPTAFNVSGLERLEYCKKTGCLADSKCKESHATDWGWYSAWNKPSEQCVIEH